ncbi:MAG TPA: hypothetical protein VIF64_14605 [Pyrinomonadaceae bacterium]|jgi:hypothetical protein
MDTNLDKRYQTLIVLWFAILMSVLMYFVLTLLSTPAASKPRNSSLFVFGLTALGTLLVIVSFLVKAKLLERSVEKQDVILVQKALLFACAICEVTALLGVIEFFLIGTREYYLLLLGGAAGIALHFPRRSQLEAASYKNPGQFR